MRKGEETGGHYVSREEALILPVVEPYPRPLIAVSRHHGQLQQKSKNEFQTVPPRSCSPVIRLIREMSICVTSTITAWA